MAPEKSFQTSREILSDTHKKVSQMYNVMYGDKEAGIPGIAHRVKTLEKVDRKRSAIYTLISALSAGIALAVQSAINHMK